MAFFVTQKNAPKVTGRLFLYSFKNTVIGFLLKVDATVAKYSEEQQIKIKL